MKLFEPSVSQQEIEQLVFNEYDFYPHRVEVLENTRKVVCDRGSFALKETAAPSEQLQWLEKMFFHLKQRGFPHMIPFLRNKFGDSFVQIENKQYYATEWINDRIEEKYRDNWELRIARGIGRLHAATLQPASQEANPLFIDLLLKRWKNRFAEMKEYKQFAESREIASPLELAFISHFPYLSELSSRAIKYLEKWKDRTKDSEFRTVLSHGQIKRSNVVHDEQQIYFINFDQAKIETPVRDLALFIRRHMGKLLDQNEEYVLEWLEEYEKEFPLLKDEKLLLAILLLFPERVYKEVEIYYQGIRDWPPRKQIKYFEKQLQLTHKLRRFVQLLVKRSE